MGVFSAEGGQFIGGHGMSEDNRLKTAAALSGVWDGEPIKRVRKQHIGLAALDQRGIRQE